MPHYLSLRVVIMRFKVRNKWGTGACGGASPSIYFTLGEAFSFIGTRGRHLMSHQRQMWNQSKVWIQNQMVQVPRGWNVWHRASEGQQQRNHYANSRPLCLTSNNTALYICKAWQDTVHTGLLSKWSHARLVTPNGWPLSALRLLGQTSHFIPTDAHEHWHKLSHV